MTDFIDFRNIYSDKTARGLILSGLHHELERIEGVSVVSISDCFRRSEFIVRSDEVGNGNGRMRICLHSMYAVLQSITKGSIGVGRSSPRMLKLRDTLKAYGFTPVRGEFEGAERLFGFYGKD